MNLRFRDGSVEDAARIADLGRQTFAEYFGQVYKKSDLDHYLDKYFSVPKVERDLGNPDYDYRVAEAPSGLVGYAKIGPVSLPVDQSGRTGLQLHRLYVREIRQGVGVGGILLSWAIDRASERGADDFWLGVWAQNKRAIGVYESRGFVASDYYDIHVGESIDKELMMSLRLKAAASSLSA
ncbi:MAG: GNAT family N-acetyltransferase [Ponticaulis sp.]|nr:GNAT family N-acetyltransferase [Ponticaulis sp.]|tara:strand:+ start:40013 stop:40555 length:543 start_codon:yes stop_codon:yes gene_type:complete